MTASASVLVVNNLIADNVLATGANALNVGGAQSVLNSNWVGNNAGLLPLTVEQGGLVPVHPLAENSPAIDHGSDASYLPEFDQRGGGFPRRRPSRCRSLRTTSTRCADNRCVHADSRR